MVGTCRFPVTADAVFILPLASRLGAQRDRVDRHKSLGPDAPQAEAHSALTHLSISGNACDMERQPRFVMVDPATDQVLWACSGATAEGRCPVADTPPYVCQGLRLVAAGGTRKDGFSFTVDTTVPGRCPAAEIS